MLENLPNYQEAVGYIIAQLAQFMALSALIVGVVNQTKNSLPDAWKKYMRVISIIYGIFTMFVLTKSFPDAFAFNGRQVFFFGTMIGLGASGLYETGLGKTKKIVEQTVEVFEDLPIERISDVVKKLQ